MKTTLAILSGCALGYSFGLLVVNYEPFQPAKATALVASEPVNVLVLDRILHSDIVGVDGPTNEMGYGLVYFSAPSAGIKIDRGVVHGAVKAEDRLHKDPISGGSTIANGISGAHRGSWRFSRESFGNVLYLYEGDVLMARVIAPEHVIVSRLHKAESHGS